MGEGMVRMDCHCYLREVVDLGFWWFVRQRQWNQWRWMARVRDS